MTNRDRVAETCAHREGDHSGHRPATPPFPQILMTAPSIDLPIVIQSCSQVLTGLEVTSKYL